MLHGHGDDGYLFDKNIVADFSSNVYYGGMDDGLTAHLADSLLKLNNYPEVSAQRLQKALAKWHNVTPEEILVTNGATEAFYLIAHAYRHSSATIVTPAFAEYEDACIANDMQVQFIDWEPFEKIAHIDTDLVFLGSPNNPTGKSMPSVRMAHTLMTNPETTFVVDEAYLDFSKKLRSLLFLRNFGGSKKIIIVKSLTKTYSIPGLRLGYIIASPEVIEHIERYKMPWSVNTLAIEAGLYIVDNAAELAIPVNDLHTDTAMLMIDLRPYVTVFESQTNFFLCKTNKGTAAELKAFLLNEHGVLIRDASNFRTLTPQHFRVATQTPEKNALLIKGIAAWMKS